MSGDNLFLSIVIIAVVAVIFARIVNWLMGDD